MRFAYLFVAILCSTLASACATKIEGCQVDHTLVDGGCVCRPGTIEDDGGCAPDPMPLADGGSERPGPHPERTDAGMSGPGPVDPHEDGGPIPPPVSPDGGAQPGPVPMEVCGGRCPSGRCDATGKCVECFLDTDCRTAGRPLCQQTACVQCRSSSDCVGGVCSNGMCQSGMAACDAACRERRCADAQLDVDLGEECVVGVGGWDEQSCDKQRCRRKFWRLASSAAECSQRTMYDELYALCMPFVGCGDPPCPESPYNLTQCPRFPDLRVFLFAGSCVISCDPAAGRCPTGLVCTEFSAPPLDVKGICVNPSSWYVTGVFPD